MIKVKIKIKSTEAKKYEDILFLDDNYVISKQNAELQAKVQKVCEDSHIEDIQDVNVTAYFEW